MSSEEARDILSVEYIYDSDRMHTAKTLAAEALEKQIPRKPKMEYDGVITKEYCPFCSNSLFPNDRFCQWCGQAIDWSK